MISFSGSTGQYLKRTAGGFLSQTSDYTILVQSRLLSNSAPGDGTTVFVLGSRLSGAVVDYSAPFIWHGYTNSGSQNLLEFEVYNTAPELQHDVDVGDCHWASLIYTASTHSFKYIVDGVVIGNTTFNMSTHGLVIANVGSDVENAGVAHDVCRYREWQAALTLSEVTIESRYDTAQRTANLFVDTPLLDPSDVTDVSGNGRNWTKTGSPTMAVACPVLSTCSGGGAINVVADPEDGQPFTGRSLSPRAWLTISYDDADRSFAIDTLNHPDNT